jgi:hypothetical protein
MVGLSKNLPTEKKIPQSFCTKKGEAFKTVCFKSLKALFSVEADKPF